MKQILAALLLTGAALAQDDIKRLSPNEIKQLMQEKVFLLDVRPAEEIAADGTLKGYVNIPLNQLEDRLDEIPKDRRIITACAGGGRASRAAALLKSFGYNVVGACGLKGADKQGLELIYPKPDAKK